MLRTKRVNAGLEWQVEKTVGLYEFILEEGARVSAPEGKFVALTVNGIGKELKAPCHYQGDIVLTVAESYHMAPHGLMRVNQISRAFADAVVIADGAVEEAKGVPAMVQGGRVTGEKAEGVYIASEAESFNGILVTGDSAYEVKDKLVEALDSQKYDFICLNFANGDMVGHTGVYDAIVKAVKAVDECVGEVVEAAKRNGYEVVQIADHGNADNAINADGTPNTAHSLNPVPIVVVSDRVKTVHDGVLADVAPTVLKLMGLEQPAEMTGKVLVELK